MKNRPRPLVPGIVVALLDLLMIGGALMIFALYHHVLPQKLGGSRQSIVSFTDTPAPMETPAPVQADADDPSASDDAAPAPVTPEPTATPTPAPGDFSASFPASDLPMDALYSYADDGLRIVVTRYQETNLTYYLADVYVRNIQYFRTAFSGGDFSRGTYVDLPKLSGQLGAVLAVSGDFCSARSRGVVIRNGELYRESLSDEDVCVLYADGVMETYYADEFDLEAAVARGAYQAWTFGPKLIDNGAVPGGFRCSDAVFARNPRSAIGYYAPGHYCLVTVDGRQGAYSKGLDIRALSQLFLDLGCVDAFNLDGGQTAAMAWGDAFVNQPYKGGRSVGDVIYFTRSAQEGDAQ